MGPTGATGEDSSGHERRAPGMGVTFGHRLEHRPAALRRRLVRLTPGTGMVRAARRSGGPTDPWECPVFNPSSSPSPIAVAAVALVLGGLFVGQATIGDVAAVLLAASLLPAGEDKR